MLDKKLRNEIKATIYALAQYMRQVTEYDDNTASKILKLSKALVADTLLRYGLLFPFLIAGVYLLIRI